MAHVFNRIKVTDIHNLNSKCQYAPKLMGNRDLFMDFHFLFYSRGKERVRVKMKEKVVVHVQC